MATIEPPPNQVNEFNYKWREWLNRLWQFVQDHTGGNSTGGTGSGTDWNAHGNTAVGAAASPLKVSPGSFIVSGATGDVPSDLSSAGTYFSWTPSKWALRLGTTTDNKWATQGAQSVVIGNDANAAGSGVAIGGQASISGAAPVAVGNGSSATNTSALAIGTGCASSTIFGSALGYDCSVSGVLGSVAIGTWAASTAQNAVAIGIGTGSVTKFTNIIPNSIMLGAFTTAPTLTLRSAKCGVENSDPKSTLDVGGSVGYQADYINSGSGKTLANQLVVVVDTAGAYTITLPQISTVPRRMYHIRRGKSAGVVTIQPNGSDSFDEGTAGVSDGGATLNPGDSIQIVADTSPTTDTWWII